MSTPLASFTADDSSTGDYAGPGRSEIEKTFGQFLACIFARAETPRLSGVQIKAPMSLTEDRRPRGLTALFASGENPRQSREQSAIDQDMRAGDIVGGG